MNYKLKLTSAFVLSLLGGIVSAAPTCDTTIGDANCGTVRISWDFVESTGIEPTPTRGRVWCNPTPQSEWPAVLPLSDLVADTPARNAAVTFGLIRGATYYCAVTAYADIGGDSEYALITALVIPAVGVTPPTPPVDVPIIKPLAPINARAVLVN